MNGQITPSGPTALRPIEVEVLVVGLGPAGSTALRILASSGISALGVDRAEFPREKPCGGGVSARTLPFLPENFMESLPHQTTQGISLTLRGKREQRQDFGRPIAYQVRRDQFDLALLEQARETGARIMTGIRDIRLSRRGGGFVAMIGEKTVFARAVMAADGATSKVLRDLDPDSMSKIRKNPLLRPWTSAEGWASLRDPLDARFVAIDLGLVDGGYAWSFPKKDSLWGLGVAGFLKPLGDPRSVFSRYLVLREAELDSGGALTWPLPNFRAVRHGRIPGLFLVGDAGGIVDPFLGEGIYYAVLSGTKAAESYIRSRNILRSGPDLPEQSAMEYVRWLDRNIWPDFRQGSRLARTIYRFPGVFFALTGRYPKLLELYASILTGDHDYRSFSREVIRRALGRLLPNRRPAAGRVL